MPEYELCVQLQRITITKAPRIFHGYAGAAKIFLPQIHERNSFHVEFKIQSNHYSSTLLPLSSLPLLSCSYSPLDLDSDIGSNSDSDSDSDSTSTHRIWILVVCQYASTDFDDLVTSVKWKNSLKNFPIVCQVWEEGQVGGWLLVAGPLYNYGTCLIEKHMDE